MGTFWMSLLSILVWPLPWQLGQEPCGFWALPAQNILWFPQASHQLSQLCRKDPQRDPLFWQLNCKNWLRTKNDWEVKNFSFLLRNLKYSIFNVNKNYFLYLKETWKWCFSSRLSTTNDCSKAHEISGFCWLQNWIWQNLHLLMKSGRKIIPSDLSH